MNDVTNFLFSLPGQGGFDLASMNIQRDRDLRLASCSDGRLALGLTPVVTTLDPEIQQPLRLTYETVEHVDVWIGGLAEDHLLNAMAGERFHSILVAQFKRLRDGTDFLPQHLSALSDTNT